MAHVRELQDIPTAIVMAKRLQHWANSLILQQSVVATVRGDEGSLPADNRKVMPSVAPMTQDASEPAHAPKQKAHAVHIESMAPEVTALFRPVAPAFALTAADRYILTILQSHRPKALTIREIIRESVRMNQEDSTAMRRLSDSTVRSRLHVLESQRLVARPLHTQKKGTAITELGLQAINLALANSPQRQR
jgi:hypothetical protein